MKRTSDCDDSYTTYEWDHRNRLNAVTDYDDQEDEQWRVEYRYDANDNLIGRKVFLNGSSTADESQIFVYENDQVVLQFDGTGNGDLDYEDLSHRYLWGPAVDQALADEVINDVDPQQSSSNDLYWGLTDHLGTPRDWIENDATLVDHAIYDVFGRRQDTPVVENAVSWTGRYRDPLTGLQWNRARWYNPDIQRWMSQDPIGFEAGDANLQRYAGNGPTMSTDPQGLQYNNHRPIYWPGGGNQGTFATPTEAQKYGHLLSLNLWAIGKTWVVPGGADRCNRWVEEARDRIIDLAQKQIPYNPKEFYDNDYFVIEYVEFSFVGKRPSPGWLEHSALKITMKKTGQILYVDNGTIDGLVNNKIVNVVGYQLYVPGKKLISKQDVAKCPYPLAERRVDPLVPAKGKPSYMPWYMIKEGAKAGWDFIKDVLGEPIIISR